MEAVAAFSIACNVMQTIKFTCEVADACKKVFRDGSTDPGLLKLTKDSVRLFGNLAHSLDQNRPRTADEEELFRIAEDCMAASKTLIAKLNKVSQPRAQRQFWRSIPAGLQAKLRESEIEKLRGRMQAHKEVLELRLLVRVW